MALPRVVYLSAPPLGEVMLEWLKTQPCEIEYSTTTDDSLSWLNYCKGSDYFHYDLGLNFLGTRKVMSTEINRPHLGWVNFHPAPLPEFGGRNLAYYAIMKNAKEFGATVHYMDEGFDTGDIIEVVRFPIQDSDTAGDLMLRAKNELIELFKKWVPKLLQGRVHAVPQDGKTRYFDNKKKLDDIMNRFSVPMDHMFNIKVRALTCHPKHHAKLIIGGRTYNIVPEEKE